MHMAFKNTSYSVSPLKTLWWVWCIASTVSFVCFLFSFFFCHKQVLWECQINSFFIAFHFLFEHFFLFHFGLVFQAKSVCAFVYIHTYTHAHQASEVLGKHVGVQSLPQQEQYTCRWVTSPGCWNSGKLAWSSLGLGMLAVLQRGAWFGEKDSVSWRG